MDVDITEFEEITPDELHLVKRGANGFPALFAKAVEEGEINLDDLAKASDPSDADRKKMAASGEAMPDGSYPIPDVAHLKAAIKAVGRGKADHSDIRKHIMKRAKALGQMALVPDNWQPDGTVSKAYAPTSDDGIPGSKTWEQADADRLNAATNTLLDLKGLLEDAAAREQTEGATVDSDDMQQAWSLQDAVYMLGNLLGVVAGMAAIEQRESDTAMVTKAIELAQSIPDLLGRVAGSNSADGAEKGVLVMDVTPEELAEMIKTAVGTAVDEREAAAKAAADEKAATEAAEAAKAEGEKTEPAEGTPEGAPAAKSTETPAAPTIDVEGLTKALAASVADAVKAELDPLKARLAVVEGEPTAGGPFMNTSGLAPILRGPSGDLTDLGKQIKELQEKFDTTTEPVEKARLGQELFKAKYKANTAMQATGYAEPAQR